MGCGLEKGNKRTRIDEESRLGGKRRRGHRRGVVRSGKKEDRTMLLTPEARTGKRRRWRLDGAARSAVKPMECSTSVSASALLAACSIPQFVLSFDDAP